MNYQPKTGEKCHCRKGVERDNCPQCEGTGWRIDFKAIREQPAQRIDVTEFCQRERIKMSCERTYENPNMDGSSQMDHWKCILRHGSKRITIVFSMGIGHNGKTPKVDEVMNCLASDFVEDGTTFEDFCSEFGYDTDSRKAEKVFRACQSQTKKLRYLLGRKLANDLVFETERL